MSDEKKKDVILETDADAIRLGRTLLRVSRFGALATVDPDDGAPFATRVATATDLDGAPLILVSGLSAHTRGLEADPRCSLLIGEPGKGDPLAHPRLTVKATAQRPTRLPSAAIWRAIPRRNSMSISPTSRSIGWSLKPRSSMAALPAPTGSPEATF